MTLFGLLLMVALSIFFINRFDAESSRHEQQVVARGLARNLEQLDDAIAPQINWDMAVKNLDHRIDPKWANFNLGSYLYTFYGFTHVFVVDRDGQPIYAAARGEQAAVSSFAPFAAISGQLLPMVRAAEAARPPLGPRPGKDNIRVPPINANGFARVDGQVYIVVASLVQPDFGRILPLDARAPVTIAALPVNQAMLRDLAGDYLLDNLRLDPPGGAGHNDGWLILQDPAGAQAGVLVWSLHLPGSQLFARLMIPLLAVLLALGMAAWMTLRRGAGVLNELLASEARSRHLAFHDALTQLPNRAMLFEHLRALLSGSSGPFVPLAVMCVDLDRFKEVNDTFGHQAGDHLIEQVALRLRLVCGEEVLIARLGGDEFVVLLRGVDHSHAEVVAENIIAEISRPFGSEFGMIEVGCSIGIALVERAGLDASEVMRWADLALYRSKDMGRLRATFFEPEMDAALRNRRSLETDLRKALGDGSLDMVYQPQIERNGTFCGVEALVRWNHPERGTIPPGVFVPLAEETGLILALGEAVLRRVFTETRNWASLRVAINVSPLQMRFPGFAAVVLRLVAEFAIDPSRYEIELTETALLDDDEATAANVEAFKRMGFSLALDDFGTGYSSLSVLQRFSVDKIKIDHTFTNCLGNDGEFDALVEAMIRLARALGLKVVAEGVETDAQWKHLVALGCHQFQGYLLGRPITASEVEEIVSDEELVPETWRRATRAKPAAPRKPLVRTG